MKYFVILLLIFIACNPVRQVLKDNAKFEIVAKEAVRRGWCANDTTITSVSEDSVITDSTSNTTVPVLTQDSTKDIKICNFDTILKSGTHIALKDGVLVVNEKILIKKVTITKDKIVTDNSRINLLEGDILRYQDSLHVLQSQILVHKEKINTIQEKLAINKLYILGLLLLIALYIFLRIKKIFI